MEKMAESILTTGTTRYTFSANNPEKFYDIFKIVRFSDISLGEPFLQWTPETKNQQRIKNSILYGKKTGLNDFRRAIIDPSFDSNKNIVYQEKLPPAIGRSPIWWSENAKKLIPSKNSRICTTLENDVFLGTIIKFLVDSKLFNIDGAWREVCDNSSSLGNLFIPGAKPKFENTGNHPVDIWYDLANTCKIIFDPETSEYCLASAYFCFYVPLANIIKNIMADGNLHYAVGSIVSDV